jgi:hypothetical protein
MATTTTSVSGRKGELQPLQVGVAMGRTLSTILIYALLIGIGLILFTPFILTFRCSKPTRDHRVALSILPT